MRPAYNSHSYFQPKLKRRISYKPSRLLLFLRRRPAWSLMKRDLRVAAPAPEASPEPPGTRPEASASHRAKEHPH